MNTKVTLYDSTTIDQFKWPETEDGKKARDYLYPLIKEGISSYLLNVSTKIYLVSYQNLFFPLTVNEKEYENSYIASNYYALKFYEESVSKKHPFLLQLQKPFLFLGRSCLRMLKVNKTILLNNWLMTNSLAPPQISTQQLGQIIDFLKRAFPFHTIIFRHVDTTLKKDLLDALKNNKFHILKTREIFLYNPHNQPSHSVGLKKMYHRDLKVLKKYNFTIVSDDEVKESDYPRLLTLYEMLYIDKYTKYSPQYTQKFLKMIHQSKMFRYVLLKREDVIEGFFCYFVYHNAMINCLFGYDTSLPHAHQIYKVLTRLVLEKAKELGLIINDGSGGEAAKVMRGMKASTEYMGLCNDHLPLVRRFLWNSFAFLYKKLTSSQSLRS